MKVVKTNICLTLVMIIGLVFSTGVFAQVEGNKEPEKIAKAEKVTGSTVVKSGQEEKTVGDDPRENDDPEKIAEVYTNYLSEYRLGPNDIISVEVFGQCPDYCKIDVTVPPTAKISYPLIPGGVRVGGRTVEEVAAVVTKQLDEYIIDPDVTVTLVKAGSARYSVVGNVLTPGVRIMDSRISVNEAILNAGGIAKGADKRKVLIARFSPEGFMQQQPVNLLDIERGKAPTVFLRPGDQVIVPGKKFTWNKFLNVVTKVAGFRGLLGTPL